MKAALGSSAEPAPGTAGSTGSTARWLADCAGGRRGSQPPGTAGAGGGSEAGGDAADAPAEESLWEETS